MHLEGSCHCGAVTFALESEEPVPYQLCYCSICRKTAGGGGYAINLMGDTATLKIKGKRSIGVYRARLGEELSKHERHFCGVCGSHLWAFHPDWPELVHPVAGAIDTPLPIPAERSHMMLGSRAPWVAVPAGPNDQRFEEYPDKSLADWHRAHPWADWPTRR